MRANRKKNNIIIGGLCAILLIMTVGYAAFYSQLKISGTSTVTSSWDVEITNIESKNIVGSASNKTEPTYTKLAATFNTNLVSPSDSITYDITVENKGSIDATLKTITKTDTSNSAILFETSGLKEGGTLQAGMSATLTVKVTYDSSVTKQPDNLTSTLKVTLDFVQNSGDIVPISGKTPADLIAETVTTGDGLYVDDTETGRYVYKGANPNNYITLGSDIYRIISVESDGTLKVIKNGSIGDRVFDTQNARYSTVSTDYCNSTYGCKVWGSKTTMLDSSGNNVTTMPREIGGTSYNLPDTEAYINTYLNSTWLNSLSSSVQSKIVTHMFNVGVVKSTNGQTLATDVSQEQAYKWKGKVGLMNASDYVKASTNSASCTCISVSKCYIDRSTTHNWIYEGPGEMYLFWTISPISSSSSDTVFIVNSGYMDTDYEVYNMYIILPTFFLSSDISLLGEGTEGSPYTLN